MLPRFIVPSILLAASLNGVVAAPLQNGQVEAKRDLGDILSGIASVAEDILGPSAVADAEDPIESIIGDVINLMDPSPDADSPLVPTPAAQPTVLAITGILTMPGGALWTPPALATSTSMVTALPTPAPYPAPYPASMPMRRDNILSDILNGGLASVASDVLNALPSNIAAPASSLVNEFIGPSPSSNASTTGTPNAATRIGGSHVSLTAIAAVVGSVFVGSLVVL